MSLNMCVGYENKGFLLRHARNTKYELLIETSERCLKVAVTIERDTMFNHHKLMNCFNYRVLFGKLL
jgi:hypothetical protein